MAGEGERRSGIEGVLERRYARNGLRYLHQVFITFGLWSLLMYLVAVTAIALAFEADGRAVLVLLVMVFLAIPAVVSAAFVIWSRRSQPFIGWIKGDRSSEAAADAWSSGVRSIPRSIAIQLGLALPVQIAASFIARQILHSRAWSIPVFVFANWMLSVIVVGGGTLLGGPITIRPILREIAGYLPERAFERSRFGLGHQVVARLGVATMAAIVIGGSVGGVVRDPALRMLVLFTVGPAVALLIGIFLFAVSTVSLTAPINELIDASRRVRRGELDTSVAVLSSDELGELSQSFNEMVGGLRERQDLLTAFGNYLDPAVVDRIVREGTLLEGAEVNVTLLMLDIRGFTSLADRSPAKATVGYLNDFFAVVVPVLRKHGGYPNKFMGDGLLAVFGTPVSAADHADRAVAASVELVQRLDGRYEVGIGINSGEVVAGTVGCEGALDFTLIGDAVNVASRLEQLTKETGDRILLSGTTRDLLSKCHVSGMISRGAHQLRGKRSTIDVYALGGMGNEGSVAGVASARG